MYETWWRAIRILPANKRLMIYEAIFEYAFEEKEANIGELQSLFAFLRGTIAKDMGKQKKKVVKSCE